MKIRIVTPDRHHAEAWSDALSRQASSLSTVVQPMHEVNVLINGNVPDLVVAEVSSAKDFEAFEALASGHPEIEYVLIGTELSTDMLMRAMRAGVREVLPAPASAEAVAEAVQRVVRKRPAAPAVAVPVEDRKAEVISVLSCKGGSGATFVAANLAHLLAVGGQRKVALIDLNLQFGDAALFVSSERMQSDVAEVARNVSRMDAQLLQSAMTQVSPGLWVLPAPDDPALAADVGPEHVLALLKQARSMFDFIVIDAGRALTAVTLQALDASDRVYPVLQLTLPFIRDGKRLRDVFRSLDYPARKIHWLVNRWQKDSTITLDDLKKTMGITEVVVLPNDYRVVADSVNQGLPVERIAAGSAVAKALRELAAGIAPVAVQKSRGWFSGLRPQQRQRLRMR